MKKLFYSSALLLCAGASFAQPSLQSADLTVGQNFDVFQLSNVTMNDLLASGANVTWDLSASTATSFATIKFESMVGNPHAATYPDANFAMKQIVGTQTQYSLFRNNGTKLEQVATSVGTPNEQSFVSYRTATPFPYTFNTMDVDTYQKTSQAPKIITHNYEAYGNVITAGGTYSNLVREVINDDGNISYMWWNTSPMYPVLQATSSNVTLFKPSVTGIKETATKNSIHIYPNPATDHISILNEKPVQKLEIYNTTGALMLTTTQSLISLAGFSPGIYFVKAYTKEAIETQSFIKQ